MPSFLYKYNTGRDLATMLPHCIPKYEYVDLIVYTCGISDAYRYVWRCPSTLCYTCDTG